MDVKSFLTVKNISFTLMIIFIVFLLFKMTDIALLLFCSYVITCAINPAVEKMSKKMPRSAAVAIMIFAIIAVTLGILIPIVVMSFNEIKEFINHLPAQIDKLQSFIVNFKIAGQNIASYLNIDTVLQNSSDIAKGVIDKSINRTVGFFGILTI